MIDPYRRDKPGLSDPGSNLIAITPDDDRDLEVGIKALRIFNGTDATAQIVLTTVDGNTVTIKVPALCLWTEPVRVKRIYETTTEGVELHGYLDQPVEN